MTTTLPRVILVEDDASIRQFVGMALEDLPLQLLSCPSLQSAREALRLTSDDLALVLLDMMLPDGSGLELLRDPVRMRPDLSARWVVFSAGMPSTTRSLLVELGVEQVLDKPVPLDLLVECVESACEAWCATRPSAAGARASGSGALASPKIFAAADVVEDSVLRANAKDFQTQTLNQTAGQLKSHEMGALQQYFFGQLALFETMKAQSLARLPDEMTKIEQCIAQRDDTQLRRAAHNLKSVTRMMGQTRASDLARALEDAAEHDEVSVWQGLWNGLRSELEQWLADESRAAPSDSSRPG